MWHAHAQPHNVIPLVSVCERGRRTERNSSTPDQSHMPIPKTPSCAPVRAQPAKRQTSHMEAFQRDISTIVYKIQRDVRKAAHSNLNARATVKHVTHTRTPFLTQHIAGPDPSIPSPTSNNDDSVPPPPKSELYAFTIYSRSTPPPLSH